MKRLLLFLSILLCMGFRQPPRVILVIVAHPDDETAFGAVLAKYSRISSIQLVIATDGRDGTRVTSIPAGDSLAAVRRLEGQCSCEKLGIKPPVYLQVEKLDSKYNLRTFWKETKQAKDTLKQLITRLQPDMIITLGPDGDTGHPEHRVIGALVTELILREGWVNKYPLYYLAWTKQQAERMDVDELMYMADQYANVRITYSAADEAQAWESLRCYKSQYTEKEFEETIATDKADSMNTMYFRRFVVLKEKREGF